MFSPSGPKQLNAKHLIAAALAACGVSQKEICDVVELSQPHVSLLMQSGLFQAEVERLRDKIVHSQLIDAVGMLVRETKENVETLVSIRDNKHYSPNVRLRAVDSMLDRVKATSKKQEIEHSQRELNLSNDQVEYLLTALDDDPVAQQAFKDASQRSWIELVGVAETSQEENS